MGVKKVFQKLVKFLYCCISWMKTICAMLQMIYEKKQSLKRSEDTRQKALEEQKSRYQSNRPRNRESHAEQLFYLLDWHWGCNHAVDIRTLALNREKFDIPFPLLGRDTMKIW